MHNDCGLGDGVDVTDANAPSSELPLSCTGELGYRTLGTAGTADKVDPYLLVLSAPAVVSFTLNPTGSLYANLILVARGQRLQALPATQGRKQTLTAALPAGTYTLLIEHVGGSGPYQVTAN